MFLDDLNLIQDLPASYASAILKGLFFPGAVEYLKAAVPFGTSDNIRGFFLHCYALPMSENRFRFDSGSIFINGEILDFDMTVLKLTIGSPFYVIVHTVDSDVRTLECGEQASCRQRKYVELSSEAPPTGEYYSSADLSILIDGLYSALKSKLDIES